MNYLIIGVDGRPYGPVNLENLRQWIREGRADAQTLVQTDASTEWKPLGALPEFSADLPASAALVAQPSYSPYAYAPAPGPAPTYTGPFMAPGPIVTTNGLAVTSLIMGILAVTIGLCCCGPLWSLLGIIFGIIGLVQVGNRAGQQIGKGLAIAGLVLSVVGLILQIILMFFLNIGPMLFFLWLAEIAKELERQRW